MAQRPTPQQLLIRRFLAVVIVLIVGFVAIKLTTGVVSAISSAFSGDPQQTTAPTNAANPTNKNNLNKCNDEDISIAVGFEGKTNFTSEEVIVIDATFTLTGSGTCLRDMGARANEIYVVNANNKKVWSTDTCPVNNKSNLVEMNPGNTYRTTITWAGNVDPKTCGNDAKHLPAGEYGIYASNGNKTSERATITFE